jgi:hypothetical protein
MTASPVSVQTCAICARRSWLPGFGDAAMAHASAIVRVLTDGPDRHRREVLVIGRRS